MIKNISIGLFVVLAVIGLFTSHNTINQNNALKNQNNALRSQIDSVYKTNIKLIDSIRQDSLIIAQKENTILRIKSNITKIKQDEKIQVENYLNSDIDKRIKLFTEYATSTD